jgi:hypothetical protein
VTARARGAAVAAAIAVGVAGVLLSTPWLPLEEAAAVQGARDLGAGAARAGWLYELLLALPARVLAAGALLSLAKVVSAVCWALLALPAYALARRVAPVQLALAAAVATVVCSGAVYATTALPDTLALLLAACALAAAADERPVAAVALAVAAALARPWFWALPFALAWALAPPARREGLRRWPGAAVLAVVGALLYAAYLAADASVGAIVRDAFGSLALASLALGVVPVPLAWGARDAVVRPLLGPATIALALGGGLAGGDERPALALAPLVLALAAGALATGWSRSRALAAAIALTAAAVVLPWPPARAEAGALAAALWRDVSHLTLVAVVAALALLPVVRVSRIAPALAAAALLLGGAIAAWVDVTQESRALRLGVPLPKSQVDDAVGRGAFVTWALTGNADPRAVAEAELWNRALRRVVRVDPAAADPDTGILDARRTEYGVGAIPLAGPVVASIPLGAVRRLDGPLRIAEQVNGVYPDGWSGFETTYRRFSGPQSPGTIRIAISRKGWTGPPGPIDVTADSAPLGGRPFAERTTTVHTEIGELLIPVPPPPFAVVVHVSPTGSLGGGDTRQLGAKLRFRYVTA